MVLTDEKRWDEWKRATRSTIFAHGCDHIIDPLYVPVLPEDKELFKEQNNFIYDVFQSIIKTIMGSYHVRKQEDSRDSQEVWSNYLTYMTTSTREDMEIDNLLKTLTSLRLPTTHSESSQSFIVRWLDSLRQYESLTPVTSHFPAPMKKAMLQNAIAAVSAFKDVHTAEQMDIARGRGGLSFSEYVGVVQNMDAAFGEQYNLSVEIQTRSDIQRNEDGSMIEFDTVNLTVLRIGKRPSMNM